MELYERTSSAHNSGNDHALPPFPVLLRIPRMDTEKRRPDTKNPDLVAKNVEVVTTTEPAPDVSLPSEPVRSWLGTLGITLVWLLVLALPLCLYLGSNMMTTFEQEAPPVEMIEAPSPTLEVVTEPKLIPIEEPVSRGAMLEPMIIPIDDGEEP